MSVVFSLYGESTLEAAEIHYETAETYQAKRICKVGLEHAEAALKIYVNKYGKENMKTLNTMILVLLIFCSFICFHYCCCCNWDQVASLLDECLRCNEAISMFEELLVILKNLAKPLTTADVCLFCSLLLGLII
jgi:hypothetical protein